MTSIAQTSQISARRNSTGNFFLRTTNVNVTRDHNGMNLDNVKGSPYYNENFLLGSVYVKDKAVKEKFEIRYNSYYDEMEIKKNNAIETLIKDEDYSCSIMGVTYIYHTYQLKKNKGYKSGYLKVLHKGQNTALLMQESTKYKEALQAKTSMTSSFPARFVQKVKYFYLNTNDSSAKPLHKKSILEAFSADNKDEIKSYIKSEKIDLENTDDLIKLFKFNESLANNLN